MSPQIYFSQLVIQYYKWEKSVPTSVYVIDTQSFEQSS